MAPRRGGGGSYDGSSGSSDVCPGCDYLLETYPLGLENAYVSAAIAFSIINLLAFLVLWILSLKTKKVARPNKTKGTRYALAWALLAILCFQIIDLTLLIILDIRYLSLRRGLLIIYPFLYFFQCASDVAVVWTIFGVIRSRLQALNGETKLVKTMRIMAIVSTPALAALATALFGLYCRTIAWSINSAADADNYEYNSVLATVRLAEGIRVTRHVLQVLLSIFFVGMAVKLHMVYRSHATKSKIPIFLLALVTPWYFARSLSALATYVAFVIQDKTSVEIENVVLAITYGLFSVPIFAGLVSCAWQSEFCTLGSTGPTHFSKYDSQQPYGPVYFNNQDQILQQQHPQTMPSGAPCTGSPQFWNSGSTQMSYGNGQGYQPSVPQNGLTPAQQQQQQQLNPHASNGGFYQPQPYPPPQPGSPPPMVQQQYQQPHTTGAADLGQYRSLSPQNHNAEGVSPINTSPGQAYVVPGHTAPPGGGTGPSVVR